MINMADPGPKKRRRRDEDSDDEDAGRRRAFQTPPNPGSRAAERNDLSVDMESAIAMREAMANADLPDPRPNLLESDRARARRLRRRAEVLEDLVRMDAEEQAALLSRAEELREQVRAIDIPRWTLQGPPPEPTKRPRNVAPNAWNPLTPRSTLERPPLGSTRARKTADTPTPIGKSRLDSSEGKWAFKTPKKKIPQTSRSPPPRKKRVALTPARPNKAARPPPRPNKTATPDTRGTTLVGGGPDPTRAPAGKAAVPPTPATTPRKAATPARSSTAGNPGGSDDSDDGDDDGSDDSDDDEDWEIYEDDDLYEEDDVQDERPRPKAPARPKKAAGRKTAGGGGPDPNPGDDDDDDGDPDPDRPNFVRGGTLRPARIPVPENVPSTPFTAHRFCMSVLRSMVVQFTRGRAPANEIPNIVTLRDNSASVLCQRCRRLNAQCLTVGDSASRRDSQMRFPADVDDPGESRHARRCLGHGHVARNSE